MDQDLFPTDSPPLEELFPAPNKPKVVSPSTVRNQAGLAALVSGKDVVDSYKQMAAEQAAGYNTTYSAIVEKQKFNARNVSISAAVSVLSDPKIPFETKQRAMEAIRLNKIDDSLETEAILKGANDDSVPEETLEQGEVRLSIIDRLPEVRKSLAESQALVNSYVASQNVGSTSEQIGQLAEAYVMPFSNQKFTTEVFSRLNKGELSAWQKIKSFFASGSSVESAREWFKGASIEERKIFMERVIKAVSESDGIIQDSNTFAKIQKLREITEEDQYSNFAKYADNLSTVLDVVGMGFLFRDAKAIHKAFKTGNKTDRANALLGIDFFKPKAAPKAPPVRDASRTPQNASGASFEPAKVSTPNLVGPDVSGRIDELEAERASLLGDSGRLLEPGEVRQLEEELKATEKLGFNIEERVAQLKANGMTRKAAKEQAAKEFEQAKADWEAGRQRRMNMLSENASAAKNEQRLGELDDEINRLSKMQSGPVLRLNPIADAIKGIEWNSGLRMHHPLASGNLIGLANPQRARQLHAAVLLSGSDEAAKALFNTGVSDVANRIWPQASTPNGSVRYTPPDIERVAKEASMENIPEDLRDLLYNSGNLQFTAAERAQAAAAILNRFKNTDGMNLIPEMSSFVSKGDGNVFASAVYGRAEGGFLTPADAVLQAAHSLRELGIAERNMEVLKREGDTFKVMNQSDWASKEPGEYLVRVNSGQKMSSLDVSDWSKEEFSWNLFDRAKILISKNWGSLTRHLFNPQSIFSISAKGASRATLLESKFEKYLLSMANDFASDFNHLSKDRKNLMKMWIDKARQNETEYTYTTLKADGFSDFEIDTLMKFRNYWDNVYTLENYDLLTTLRNQKYEKLVSPNADLVVKRIGKNQNINNLYDPVSDSMVSFSKHQMDALYQNGGYYAELRRPTVINGSKVTHVIVQNTPTSYSRALNTSDKVLSYKKGYYQTLYKAPVFVVETSNDITRAIAVAGDSLTAERFKAARQSASQNGEVYTVRESREVLSIGSDEYWDVNSVGGRIAQRHRGKQLEDADTINQLGNGEHIADPIEAVVRAARSIAGRTVGRESIEAMRSRFMNQFGHLLPEVNGQRKFPRSIDEIAIRTTGTNDDVRDARTMFEYSNYLEYGYVNAADQMVKGIFNMLGQSLGSVAVKTDSKLISRGERVFRKAGETANPVSLAKNFTFMAWIANHPLRQLFLQAHQTIRLFSYSGVYMFKDIPYYMGLYTSAVAKNGKNLSKSEAGIYQFIEESGALSAIDKQNLVRGALMDAASVGNVMTRGLKKTASGVRKVGFDAGESVNQIGHLVAVYGNYQRRGLDLTNPSVRAEGVVEANAITYSMQYADDMPYNQNAFGVLLQFMQVPHKAFLQSTNKNIPLNKRFALIAGDAVLFGFPSAMIYSVFKEEDLPEDPYLRELLLRGYEQAALNNFFNWVANTDDINIDFSSLAPYDTTGFIKFFKGMYQEGFDKILENSPAGSLFLRDTGPMQTFFHKFMSYFGFGEQYISDPIELKDVMMQAARTISAGVSSAEKAYMMLATQRRLDTRGNPVDDTAHYMEAMAQLLGFGSYDQKLMMELSMKVSQKRKDRDKDLDIVHKRIMSEYAGVNELSNKDPEHARKVVNHLLHQYKDDPYAREYLYNRWSRELESGDATTIYNLMKAAGWVDKDELKDLISKNIQDPTKRKHTLEMIDAAHGGK